MIFKEHDQVVLNCALPALKLEPGDVGVVVHVHDHGVAYEVEFIALDGHTIGIETMLAGDLQDVSGNAVSH